jgi:hypothetical protein
MALLTALCSQATVFLAANVSFLALPTVLQFSNNGQGSNSEPNSKLLRSCPEILSLLSTVMSLGSVMLGMLLSRANRLHADSATDANATATYLKNQTSRIPYFHLEPLAVLYSLPFSLLLWA